MRAMRRVTCSSRDLGRNGLKRITESLKSVAIRSFCRRD